ncbi:wee1-like protein kinase [Amaranthus tricolor]|uniref:wee1-like protein kinase n=1 Tax=Amaranthus tricolor TaxID=29722 RepID=UPI00258B8FF5|nr:wee1-like protein kinase [Amaranthus tricolor]
MKKRQRKNSSSSCKNRKQLKLSSVQRPLKPMLSHFSLLHSQQQPQSLLQNTLINDSDFDFGHQSSKLDADFSDVGCSEILSQDFFCTPDYITPECQNFFSDLDGNKLEDIACPASPEKMKAVRSKIFKQDETFVQSRASMLDHQQTEELTKYSLDADGNKTGKPITNALCKGPNYVPQSAIALRSRVMPPPCLKNPYLKDAVEMDVDPFGSWRTKCSGYPFASSGAENMSRYRTDFHEIEQIGNGNFSHVYKVLKRIDGCMYAVKHSTKQLCQDTERRKALMEVQALAALGFHENIVTYYTSWFENEHLYIQMELCDYSLFTYHSSCLLTEEEILKAFFQIARALQYIHERGITHLDVKPENIYVKNGVYKLGDFGCATLLDKTLPIEEGDARYMPQEILNEKHDHLDKVDIFSLGVSIYELLRGSSLLETGYQLLREGKPPLLPNKSLQLQNLLKVMMEPIPMRRPSAKQLVDNPIFSRIS